MAVAVPPVGDDPALQLNPPGQGKGRKSRASAAQGTKRLADAVERAALYLFHGCGRHGSGVDGPDAKPTMQMPVTMMSTMDRMPISTGWSPRLSAARQSTSTARKTM